MLNDHYHCQTDIRKKSTHSFFVILTGLTLLNIVLCYIMIIRLMTSKNALSKWNRRNNVYELSDKFGRCKQNTRNAQFCLENTNNSKTLCIKKQLFTSSILYMTSIVAEYSPLQKFMSKQILKDIKLRSYITRTQARIFIWKLL